MKNVTEQLVSRAFDELLPSVPELCRCALCREDVLVYTLNRLPPHYTSTLTGEGATDYVCQACGTVICKAMRDGEIDGVLFRCPHCLRVNRVR